ncbi:MAG TPA: hypothetical protein VK447_19920 [Myxococcaceae bacterium]|nr:hypothetical protein [Myxococcaceae bacterium]
MSSSGSLLGHLRLTAGLLGLLAFAGPVAAAEINVNIVNRADFQFGARISYGQRQVVPPGGFLWQKVTLKNRGRVEVFLSSNDYGFADLDDDCGAGIFETDQDVTFVLTGTVSAPKCQRFNGTAPAGVLPPPAPRESTVIFRNAGSYLASVRYRGEHFYIASGQSLVRRDAHEQLSPYTSRLSLSIWGYRFIPGLFSSADYDMSTLCGAAEIYNAPKTIVFTIGGTPWLETCQRTDAVHDLLPFGWK